MPSLVRSIWFLMPAALSLASAASAQSTVHAKQLFDGAKFAEAKLEFLALQKADEHNSMAAYYLGRLATIDNDGDDATRQFERAVELEDGNALYHYWLGAAARDAAPRASGMAQAMLARRMKKEWERAVELDPNQVDARAGLVGFYAAAPAMMGGGMDKANEQAAEIAKRNPMRGALARGTIAEQEKNAAAEEVAYQQAIAAAPDSVAGYVALTSAYARDGKAVEAFATIDRYAKRRPKDAWALFYTGRVSGITGAELDRGESALKKFLAAPPSDAYAVTIAGAHHRLGQIAEKRGQKDAAREHYQAALKINPKSQAAQKALDALK